MKYATGDAKWRDPQDDPPPTATKVLVLTPGGVAVIGFWAHWGIAWSPLPRIPATLKAKLYGDG